MTQTKHMFYSPRYQPLKEEMMRLYKMTEKQWDEYTADKPHLFDPRYIGHDKHGNPDPVLKEYY